MDEGRKRIMKMAGLGKAVGAIEEGICPFCHQLVDVNSFRDELSRKEFKIAGLCQMCQDKTFKEEEE